MSWTAMELSPTADATRLTDRWRTSPAANTPGTRAELCHPEKSSRTGSNVGQRDVCRQAGVTRDVPSLDRGANATNCTSCGPSVGSPPDVRGPGVV